MYTVYDCGKKAQYPDTDVHPNWNNASFENLEDAVAYAEDWLGMSAIGCRIPKDILLKGYDYDGYGDIIQIKEE
jgi:hypothetical protein